MDMSIQIEELQIVVAFISGKPSNGAPVTQAGYDNVVAGGGPHARIAERLLDLRVAPLLGKIRKVGAQKPSAHINHVALRTFATAKEKCLPSKPVAGCWFLGCWR